jgi:hypothetical protein
MNSGWGWEDFDAREGQISPYRYGSGLGGGIEWAKFSVGLDFHYFLGTRFQGWLTDDPSVAGESRLNTFRLALDLGYTVDVGRFALKPHVLGGQGWQRLRIKDTVLPLERSTVWSPSLLALYHLREDRSFALGLDTRYNIVTRGGHSRTHVSNFVSFWFGF